MVLSIIAGELAKIAVRRLSDLKIEDAAKTLEQIRRMTGTGVVRSPGRVLGAFSAGIAVGTGLGVLLAPRAGAQTRSAIKDAVEAQLKNLSEQLSNMRQAREGGRTESHGDQPHGSSGNGAGMDS